MQMRHGLLVLVAACGTDGGKDDPPIDPPTEQSAIERCVADGGSLRQLWATSNQHGPVTSIAVGGSTIVLGSADGSVKQWDVNGSSPSYGTPFLDDTGVVVDAIAFSSDGQVLGADREGRLSEWRLSDARAMRTIPVANVPLEVVAVSEHAEQAAVARGSLYPDVQIIDRSTGAIGNPLTTTLWGVRSVVYGHGGVLFTAGHWYGVPMIERRVMSAPNEVIESWSDMAMTAHVHAVAIDPYVTRMAAAGDDFVAVLQPKALETSEPIVREVPGHLAIDAAMLGRDVFATVGQEGTLRLWSATTAEPIAMLSIPEPIGLGVDAAGETVFTSGPDGMLRAFGCR
ncbi:MAG: WD40 repeat domain-containing protein [Deltaproteobacteria bacterium]|nr:WD40 repeat domain-containing protein [Deltaproteobacteria bacterium]